MAQLGRFEYTIQTPLGLAVTGGSCAIYREGATVNGNQSGNSPTTFTVRHRGKVATGDTVFINAVTGTTYTATVVSATQITLSGYVGTLALSGGDRITPSNTPPTLYSDDQGGASTSNPLTSGSTGRVNCWMEFGAYDFVVSGGGATTTAFTAQVVPSQAPGQIRYADEFKYGSSSGGIQEALNDLPSTGGIVVLSANTTYTTTVAITVPQDSVHIDGGGQSTLVVQSTNATDGFVLAHNNCTVSNLTLRGTNVAGTARGISGGGNTDCLIENCVVEQWGGVQINFGNTALRNIVRNNIVRNGKNEGIYFGNGGLDNLIQGNIVYGNAKNGIDCNASRTVISNNICRNNGVSPDTTDTCGIIVGHSSGNTSTDNTVAGNICDTNVQNGIFIWGAGTVRRYTVANNICRATTDGWGIELVGGTAATFDLISVTGNVCQGNAADGIAANGVSDSTFTGNVCIGNMSDGMQMYATNVACARNAVVGNVFRSNTGRGFLADHASVTDCLIAYNQITGNGVPQIGTVTSATNMFADNTTATASLSKGADIASATTITLGNDGDYFKVTGTTTITSVTASWAGRLVTLEFTGALTFTDGSNLFLAGNFVTTTDDTITLRSDGTNWKEIARSVN